jgi:hypothetical protein
LIRIEAEKFFFGGKMAQQTLPFEEEQEEQNDDPVDQEEPQMQDTLPDEEPVFDGKMAAAGEEPSYDIPEEDDLTDIPAEESLEKPPNGVIGL